MNLQKLNPWNWFKHEESQMREPHHAPVAQKQTGNAVSARGHFDTHPIVKLQQEIDRLFDTAFSGFGLPGLPRSLADSAVGWAGQNQNWLRPQVDIAGDESKYEIHLDLPGLTEKDVSIELHGDALVIKGEKQETLEDQKNKHYYRTERYYGSFQRTLSLPEDAARDDISARLKDGVLTLQIPRREVPESKDIKRISIRS